MRVVRILLRTAGLALLATACGASPQAVSVQSSSPGPKVVIPPDVLRPPSAPLSTQPQILHGSDSRLYESLITIHHGATRIRSAYAQSNWRHALQQQTSSEFRQFSGCRGQACNQLILPAGLPGEAIRWLSLADYHWRNSPDGLIQHQSLTGIGASRTRPMPNFQVIKQTLNFEPAPGIVCTTRRKYFSDQTRDYREPGEQLVASVQRDKGIQPERWPVPKATHDEGHLFTRLMRDPSRTYRLDIHWSAGVDNPHSGEAIDWALVCESSDPLEASTLGQFSHQFVQTSEQRAIVTQYQPI